MKKTYRVTSKMVTFYPVEELGETHYFNELQPALDLYIRRLQNPETRFCCVDLVGKNNTCKKIIAAFNLEQE